ncbi:MAG: hypothetical protein EZS28_013976 [Streblomastix strix]|uniref:Uncharacterized protein n=1 Tax=Streblomastix strix TaxID=222440 RepID=A0A5J4W6L5_9EUKA|nr:MAG: hypothetical protein EZS28_013976 [Streblomastix strix]
MFSLSHNFFDVSGDSYYVGTTGYDSNSCTQDDYCLTLDAPALKETANSANQYTVYVMDKTILPSIFQIYLADVHQRTFTNNPDNSTILSEIQINVGGQFSITGSTLFERLNFTMQDGVSNEYGGVINAHIISSLCQFDITSCSFIGCNAGSYGGALYYSITTQVEQILTNLTFNQCYAQIFGGGIDIELNSGGKLTISGSCSFKECKTSSISGVGGGGGLHASINGENSSLTFEDSMTFDGCLGSDGGGMFLVAQSMGNITMTGSCSFTDCSCSNAGGGCYIIAFEPNYNINLLGNIQFEGCYCDEYAGGLCIIGQQIGQITINDMSFSGCNSSIQGGGFYSTISSGVKMTVTGKITFDNCNCLEGQGGGQYLSTNDSNYKIIITGELEYKQCSATQGGGLFADIFDNALVEINKSTFINCSSIYNGGGIYSHIESKGQLTISINTLNCSSSQRGGGLSALINGSGQLTLDKTCEFYQCQSHGNGGGIYIQINLPTQCSFLIKDAYIHECTSLNSTNSLSYPQSGFGGGLFLGTFGDYDPSTKLIDLRGMKIYNNSADKYGQSLFVAMAQVVEWCQYGILGEYIKGNYSDTYSDETDIEGIPMELSAFHNLSSELIEQQSQPLEPWWRILGILKRAQVIMNVSNPNGKLIFNLEGQSMIPGYLNVKIFEMRDKTQEEIDQEQKEIKQSFNKNNIKSKRKNSSYSLITLKHQTENHQQISISSESRILKNLRNYDNEIIYPPEDGSSTPIQINGEIESDQKATFEMNDGSWLNYKEKIYGVLISNDRKIFTGKAGIDIEDDENAAVQLEITFKEDQEQQLDDDDDKKKEEEGLPIGIIVGIAVGALAIVAVIIIIVIVAVFISKKKKSKKPTISYGPEMRARDLPMENKYPQNSHSLDAVNKAMEDNNW